VCVDGITVAQDSYQRPAISVRNVDFNGTRRFFYFCVFSSVYSAAVTDISAVLPMIYCMSPPPHKSKKKLPSVCVQIASCQFIVSFALVIRLQKQSCSFRLLTPGS